MNLDRKAQRAVTLITPAAGAAWWWAAAKANSLSYLLGSFLAVTRRVAGRSVRPVALNFGVYLGWCAVCVVLLSQLIDARAERDWLERALIDKTLQHRALVELREHEWIRTRASTDLLRSCRQRLALRDAEADSDLVRLALQGAEYYGVTTYDYLASTQEESVE